MVLARLLSRYKIDMATIQSRYRTESEAGRIMLGVVPHAYPYLEIWPTGFETYNVIVPNLLDFPQLMWGLARASRHHVGLMLYSTSRAARCMYCSAHTCTFALRRGATRAQVVAATEGGDALGPDGQALVDVGEALGRMPGALTDELRAALRQRFAPDVVEWLVLSAGMMGFLNKVMDALGVELERAVVDEVAPLVQPTGWSPGDHEVAGASGRERLPGPDSLGAKLSVIKHLPAALRQNWRRTRGVPSSWPQAGEYLFSLAGYRFPTLSHLKQRRALEAIVAALRMNLSPESSTLGLRVKYLAGLVFAQHADWDEIARGCRAMMSHPGASRDSGAGRVQDAVTDSIDAFAALATDFDSNESLDQAGRALEAVGQSVDGPGQRLTEIEIHALMLAKAAASSPARITPLVIERHASELPAPAIIELLVWLGVLQMLYRIDHFYQ